MYRTVILKGDYSKREYDANNAGADAVWHQHINSFNAIASYGLVEVARPVTDREMAVARAAAEGYARIFGGGLGSGDGVKVLEDGDRGEYIIDGNREAYISEPAFGSNPAQAAMLARPDIQRAIAQENVDALRAHYPDGSLIALSVGHKYKTSAPNDRGCVIVGTGLMEADVNEAIIGYMDELLSGAVHTPVPTTTPPPAQPSATLLARGDGGPKVVVLQQSLQHQGYHCMVDGDFGPQTDVLVRSFQRLAGIGIDGIVGPDTWGRVRGAAYARTSMQQVGYAPKRVVAAVRTLQDALNDITGAGLVVDGKFGRNTKAAVRSFQQLARLDDDGVVGPNTWRALGYR
jgi:hypothetical protein